MADMNLHVRFLRHMAGHALGANAVRRVVVMRRRVEFCRQMALRTHGVTAGPQTKAMRLMAVRTGNTSAVHPALQEGTVFEYLPIDLAIGMVLAGFQQRWHIGVQ